MNEETQKIINLMLDAHKRADRSEDAGNNSAEKAVFTNMLNEARKWRDEAHKLYMQLINDHSLSYDELDEILEDTTWNNTPITVIITELDIPNAAKKNVSVEMDKSTAHTGTNAKSDQQIMNTLAKTMTVKVWKRHDDDQHTEKQSKAT